MSRTSESPLPAKGGKKSDSVDPNQSSSDQFTKQESGASGGPTPTSDELTGQTSNPTPKAIGSDGMSSPHEATPDQPDSDYEAGDQSQGIHKRMD